MARTGDPASLSHAEFRPGLRERFESLYGERPTHVVRAPGRVNLIGEHVDYHDLPVMPFATDLALWIAFRRRADRRLRIGTTEPGMEPEELELVPEIGSRESGDWRNYVRAAARSLVRVQEVKRGADALVLSDLPVASGLSSSSALVVGVGLMLARIADAELDRARFAEQMAIAERYTGTRGGGMDQAACLLSRAAHVSLMDFDPVRVRPIPFPAGAVVVVADSGERAEKSGAVQAAYNERRESGIRALGAVADDFGRSDAGYRELVDAFGESECLERGAELLEPQEFSRYRHVVTEYGRVRAAVDALETVALAELGRLLDASHASLRDDYGVSTPALDRLVACARDAGALGARLTGAGFGGSVLALVEAAQAERVGEALASETGDPEAVRRVRPSDGASVGPVG